MIGAVALAGLLAFPAAEANAVITPASPIPAPNVTVDFGSPVQTVDPASIGVDETGYGQASATTLDQAEYGPGGLLSTLGAGYSRIRLTIDDLTGQITCWSCSATSFSGDQWITAMKAIGETPVISLQDTISPTDAAAMVTHFNETAGNPPVTYWEIGNEPDNTGESEPAYASRFNTIAMKMKTADPAIKIGGGTTSYYNSGYLRSFLQDCGSLVDFVDFHFYPTGTSTDQPTLTAQLPALSSDLASLRALISSTVPARAAQIAIHVGEWNLSYASDSLDYTGFASAWDADALGRILAAGDVGQAFGTKSGGLSVLYHAATGDLAPSGYAEDEPMPIYEALSMFTGAGLFPHFGTTMVSATSTLAGVDAFASSSPDEIVLANTSSSAQDALVSITDGGYLSAAEWQISQTGALPSSPALIATRSTRNGTFYLKLPADSVSTMVVTAPASTYQEYTLASSANTSLCLDYGTATAATTATCGTSPNPGCQATSCQNWRPAGLTLVNGQTGRCLDTDTTGDVYTSTCNGSSTQNWYSINSTLYNAQTGKCLATSGSGNLTTASCDGLADQNWTWQPAANAPVIPSGT